MAGLDRKNALIGQSVITGIDFVAVGATQTVIDVFFLNDPTALTVPLTNLAADLVSIIDAETGRPLPIASIAWPGLIDGRAVLRIQTVSPGDWGRYWLAIADARVDPFFARIEIDFKAACPSKLDCAPEPHECPAEPEDDVVIDGMARDFWSLRTALLDLAARRNPRWADRLEADVGVMLVEALAALGDEMAYYQDRVAREGRFGSASQRRSLRRHARLVDHEPHDGSGARGHLALEIDPAFPGFQLVPAGTQIWARSEGARPIAFEIGRGLADNLAGSAYRARASRNELRAHLWDGDVPDAHAAHRPLPATCLPVGATSLYVDGHLAAELVPGELVYVITDPPADEKDLPLRRHLATLVAIDDETDPLAAAMGTTADVTRLEWAEPTPFELDLRFTRVLANVMPVSAGLTRELIFSIGPNSAGLPSAVERTGPNNTISYLATLPDRDGEGLVYFGSPEIDLVETSAPAFGDDRAWTWRRSLLGTNSSTPQDRHYTLDDGTWEHAVTYRRIGETIVHRDYVSGAGTTIRFGDGEFGRLPAAGDVATPELFKARYRIGNGTRGNVPAEAIRFADPNGSLDFADVGLPFIARAWNPLALDGGVDPEALDEIRRDAPEAYRAITYRAVRPEDYDEAAERLPWVQRAGTQFRWTGSWLTAFTAADRRGASTLTDVSRAALADHLDRFRQAGRDLHVLAPRYADLDVRVVICVEATAFPGAVARDVQRALLGTKGVRPIVGFFDPDRFTFGTPLDRSELESAIQHVPGVRAVKAIFFARRGSFAERELSAYYQPGRDEVIRVDNDHRHPDRGSLSIETEGGA